MLNTSTSTSTFDTHSDFGTPAQQEQTAMPRQRVRVTKEALKLRPLFPMVEGPIEVASHRHMHLEHTGALLRKMLLRRDYHRAYKLYNIMLSCRTDISSVVERKRVSYAEEFAWKVRGVAAVQSANRPFLLPVNLLLTIALLVLHNIIDRE